MKKLLLFLVVILISHVLYAQNYRTISSGNYSDPAIWEVDNGSGYVPTIIAPIAVNANYIKISSLDTVTLDVNVTLNNANVNVASDFNVSANAFLVFENGHYIYAETSNNPDDNSELSIYLNSTIEVKQAGDFIKFQNVLNPPSTGGFTDFKKGNVSIPDPINVRYHNAGIIYSDDLISAYNVLYLENTEFINDDAGTIIQQLSCWNNSIVTLNSPVTIEHELGVSNSTINLNDKLTYKGIYFTNSNGTFNSGSEAEMRILSNDIDPNYTPRYLPVFTTLKKLILDLSTNNRVVYPCDLHITDPNGLQLIQGRIETGEGFQYTIFLDSDLPVFGNATSYVMGNVGIKVETISPTTYEYINFPIGTVNDASPIRINLATNGISSCYLTATVVNAAPSGSANLVLLGGMMSNRHYKLKVEQPNPFINSNSISSIANVELEPTNSLPALNQLSKIGFSFDNTAMSFDGIPSSVASTLITSIQLSPAQIADLGSTDGSFIGIAKNVLTPGEYCIGPSSNYTPPSGSPNYINGNSPYGNLSSAISDLQSRGCNGPITFVIQNNYSSSYTNPLPPYNTISEASPISINYQADVSRPVLFTNRTDNVTPIVITNTANSGIGVIEFDGARHVSVKGNVNNICGNYGIVIRNNASPSFNYDPGYSNCVVIKNDSKNIEIVGVQFEVSDRGISFNNNIGTIGSDSIHITCNKFMVRSDLLNTNCYPIGIAFGHNGIASPVATSNDVNIHYNKFENMARGIYFNDGISGNVSILQNHFYRTLNNNPGPQFISFMEGTKPAFFTIENNYLGGSSTHCGGTKMNTSNAQYFINLYSSGGVTSSSQKSYFNNNHLENLSITTTNANLITLNHAWDVTSNVIGNPNVTQDIYSSASLYTFNGINVATPLVANTNNFICSIKNNSINNIYCPTAVQGNFNGILSSGTTAVIESNSFKNIESGGNNFWLINSSNITPLVGQVSSFKYNTAENIKQTNTLVNNHAGIFKVENVTGLPTNWTFIGNRIGSLSSTNDILFNTTTVTPFKINIWTNATNIDSNIVCNIQLTNEATSPHVMLNIQSQAIGNCAYNTIFNIDSKSKYNSPESGTPQASLSGIILNCNDGYLTTNILVHHNKIYNLTNSNTTLQAYGIGVAGLIIKGNSQNISSYTIYNNEVSRLTNQAISSGTNPYVFGIAYNAGAKSLWYNNTISISNDPYNNVINMTGVRKFTSGNAFSYYHNTVRIGGLHTTGTTSFCLFKSANTSGTDTMINNIFYSLSDGGSNYCLGSDHNTSAYWGKSNYNSFFSSDPNQLGKWLNSTMPLTTWKTTTSTEANSLIKNVKFVDAETDLHLNPNTNCALNNAGISIPIVTTDMDGDTRNNPPDIGADEFTYIDPIVTATATNPTTCEGANLDVNAASSSPLTPLYYSWTGPNAFTSTTQNNNISNAQAINQGIYSVTVTDYYGCSGSATTSVSVAPTVTWYYDEDGDGYSVGTTVTDCVSPGAHYSLVSLGVDCDDVNATIHPGATEICGNNIDDNCDGNIDEGCNTVNILAGKLYLQGYYIGAGQMNPVLSYQGVAAPSSIADSIYLELRDENSPTVIAYSTMTTLGVDGEFTAIGIPSNLLGQSYYLVVRHRNSIETWSANAIQLTSYTYHNFTTAANKAYGENQIEIETNKWAFYTGDINQDGFVDSFDFPALDTDIFNGVSSVYVNTDLNGDGFVDSFDFPIFDVNSFNGVSVITP